jgi:hypothetical protein
MLLMRKVMAFRPPWLGSNTVDKAALALRAGQFNAAQAVEVRYSSQAAQ